MLKMTDNQQRFSGRFDIVRLLRPFAGLVVPAAAVIAALAIGALLLGVFGANPLTGYSIISAANLDEAITLAQGCPVLEGGGSVEVAEAVDM